MEITFDPAKRERTLKERGLDFAEAAQVFAGDSLTLKDERFDYGEPRFLTIGALRGGVVVIVWTPREGARRIISMRNAHAKEQRRWRRRLG